MKIWHFGYPLRRLQEMDICSRATSGLDSLFHVFGKKKKRKKNKHRDAKKHKAQKTEMKRSDLMKRR